MRRESVAGTERVSYRRATSHATSVIRAMAVLALRPLRICVFVCERGWQ